jgi:N-methylhydantoinase A/acetophenone carboxylase
VFETDVTQDQDLFELPRAPAVNGAVIMARLKAIIPAETPSLEVLPSMVGAKSRPALKGERSVFWSDAEERTPVYRGESLSAEATIQGPLIVEHEYTTILVPRGWRFRIDAAGHGIIERLST